MAVKIVSPGVVNRENDQSLITEGPIIAGAALIGPAVKGPVNEPTIITSYSDYKSKFGTTFSSGSGTFTYFTSIAAHNYFNQGGDTLLVSRVVTGSFTKARSTQIKTAAIGATGIGETGSILQGRNALLGSITQQPSGAVAATYHVTGSGTNAVVSSSNFTQRVSMSVTIIGTPASPTVTQITFLTGSTAVSPGDTIRIPSQSLGTAGGTVIGAGGDFAGDLRITIKADDLITTQSFELSTISKGLDQNSDTATGSGAGFAPEIASLEQNAFGVLPTGSSDNLRWEISSVDNSTGNFNLLIRRGDDSTDDKVILEQFLNVNLDPFSPRYIERVIGNTTFTVRSGSGAGNEYLQITGSYKNNSRYVFVSAVNKPTPNYLDAGGVVGGNLAAGDYSASLPRVGSGSFLEAAGTLFAAAYDGGAKYYENISLATNIQGLKAQDYTSSLNILNNTDQYNYNVLAFPGVTIAQGGDSTARVINNALDQAEERGNTIVLVDPENYGQTNSSTVAGRTDAYDNSYAAAYWPHCQVIDPDTGTRVFVPASTMVLGAYAKNDKIGEPWFAPAGVNRGGLDNVLRTEKTLTKANRDTLYEGKVNPIATFPNVGVCVFGQKTLQKQASALDRVNVRRLLINLKNVIGGIANDLVFENNTTATRNSFVSQANAYLETVQQKQGLFAFKVVMDDTNNTPDVIDRNQMVGQLFIQPAKTAEFIILDFNILPTGAEFPS
jgi:phage tail sheath protein FI